MIDRKNHHLFQPLLYQVAVAGLSPAQISVPIRSLFRRAKNVKVILGEVTGFDLERKAVRVDHLEIDYDFLIVAAGATHTYFAHPEWEQYAPGLKTIEDALEIRRRILLTFELAEREALTTGLHQPLNFIVIGGGPTGVELAGAIADIARRTLQREFRAIEPHQARIILLERGSRLLPSFPQQLSDSAEQQLRDLGVEVHTNALVTDISLNCLILGSRQLRAAAILWSAGVVASPLGRMLAVPVDQAGRVLVNPDLSIPGYSEVFVVGDLAAVATAARDKFVPGLAPAAMQMGKFAGRQIVRTLSDRSRERFDYVHRGSLATIGVSKAVADFGKLSLSGHLAWFTWLYVHLFSLVGFRNRLMVLLEWAWSYITVNHGARLITHMGRTSHRPYGTAPATLPHILEAE